MAQAIKGAESLQISVRGVVQGIGFRPFVYQLAIKHNLRGWVCNTSGDVRIEVEGTNKDLTKFISNLEERPPPQTDIKHISVDKQAVVGYTQFEIRPSQDQKEEYQLIVPDLATCHACQLELFDPSDKRYRYPFTNCTNCGPRFTIIENVPYDRLNTTMKQFQMCPSCQQEYNHPMNRRFHAQPNACPVCGPSLQMVDATGKIISCYDIISFASRLLRENRIIAIRGLGGFLLACNATSEEAVLRLRERKKRSDKPLAVMVASIKDAQEHCLVSPEEKALLTSSQSPIVLLRWKPTSSMAKAVAPGLRYLGVMLPYTPLHHLLLSDSSIPLVMTSGNISEEPIARDNEEALRRLNDIADYFLIHDREIYSRYDDSVTMVVAKKPRVVRRGRGYAPYPILLPFKARQVLACGAEMKNTFCFTRDNNAFLSQHIGDMENPETLEHFENTITLYQKIFRINPELIACDMHPDYLASKWARDKSENIGMTLIPIQHHHAHIVSCMVDNKTQQPVIGVSFDGTGYGTDGHIWGGEFLVADYSHFQRKGQLEYLPLPGGTAAINRPYRTAVGYLYTLLGERALHRELPCLNALDDMELDLIKRQIDRGINTPLTSSCGRLFDAVSALITVREQIGYEGQAAIELEMAATDELDDGVYPFLIDVDNDSRVIRLAELFASIITDMENGVPVVTIAERFHNTVAQMISQMCHQIAKETGITTVFLSGGVFQNRRLLMKAATALEAAELATFTHHRVPCNDGGISLGQAVIANYTL